MAVIRDGGFVFLTSNARDVRSLFAAEPLHLGFIILLPGRVNAVSQVALFGKVLDAIEPLSDLTNRMVEVHEHRQVTITEWPVTT